MTHTVDKSGWPAGPWMSEPDCAFWIDEATDLPCVILRTPEVGHLCGYVGVPPRHPCYNADNDEVDGRVDVHGGITFGSSTLKIAGPEQENYGDYFWFGFDCGHAWDLCPGMRQHLVQMGTRPNDVYKDFDYVRAEVTRLAKQFYSFLSPLELLARAADDKHDLRRPTE